MHPLSKIQYIRSLLRANQTIYTLVRHLKKTISFIIRPATTSFPTRPYRFSRADARSIYVIIRSDTLNHTRGTHVRLLEKEFARYHDRAYALATNSGTTALEMAVKAVGIMPGDEVIVPAYTFISTAQAVLAHGGIPVFADIDDTYTIDPKSIATHITPRTKAVIPVHIFGNPADMDAIMSIAKKHKLRVIEDSCQAVGALYKNRRVGSIGDIGCFSFNEKKAINTGQGGMFITQNKKMFTTALDTQDTGNVYSKKGVDVITSGTTNAMTEMQASLARSQLDTLDRRNSLRLELYNYFTQQSIQLPQSVHWYRVLSDALPSYSRLVFMIDFAIHNTTRSAFIESMRKRGVPMQLFYPKPLYSYSLFVNRRDSHTLSRYPFSLNPRIQYKKTHLRYTETFCRQQTGIEFSPYLSRRHIDLLIDSMITSL